MKQLTKYLFLLALFLGLVVNAQNKTLEFTAASASGNGFALDTGLFTFLQNTNNPTGTAYSAYTPALTARVEISNIQYSSASPTATFPTTPRSNIVFGWDGANIVPGLPGLINTSLIPYPNSYFTSGIVAGEGFNTESGGNTGISFFTAVSVLYGQPFGRYHMADITITFNRPVDNPILHFSGMGAGDFAYYTNEFELIGVNGSMPAISLSKLSGTSSLEVSGYEINNREDASDPYPLGLGSVRFNGSGITTLKFKSFIRGFDIPDDGIVEWAGSPDDITSGDYTEISVSVLEDELPPFQCNGLAYIISNTNTGGPQANYISGLQSFNLSTAVTTLIDDQLINAASNRFINGIGYNVLDNYIYGIRQFTSDVVRIGSDGNVQILPTIGSVLDPTKRYESGDVSPDGKLYVYSSDVAKMYSINLNASASDYLTPVERATGTLFFDDFAFSPIDGMIYGITRSTQRLFRFNPTTNAFTNIGAISGLSSTDGVTYGTALMDNEGNLYFANNTSGITYKINTPHLATGAVTATILTNLSVTPGDGARCPSIITPVAVADSGCATATGVSSFNVSSNDNVGTYPIDPLSTKLIDPTTLAQVSSVNIVGQGTFAINSTTGAIEFTPAAGYSGTSINYVVADVNGNYSAPAQLSLSVCIPACTGTDSDSDGVADMCDLDDDNDGILDTDECSGSNKVVNGTFANSNNWNLANWGIGSGYASITNDGNVANTNTITQIVNGLSQGTVNLNFSALFFNGGNQERLDVYLGSTRYASFVSAAGNGNVTVTTENGATVNIASFPESSSWSTGWQNIQMTFPNTTSDFTKVLKFDAYRTGSGNGDDIGLDNISLTIPNCDTDGDGIPNYLDLDSDGDGCFDAIEGSDSVKLAQLKANGSINGVIDSQGVPVLVNVGGAADINSAQGQSVGTSQDSTLNACIDTDGDGVPDLEDLDNDNDGILDCTENGFNGDPNTVFKSNGNTTVVTNPSTGPLYQFRLTNVTGQQGQAWSYGKADFSKSFTISMQAMLSDADGIAMVFQNSPLGTSASGTNGQGLGARGIANGIALELDTFQNDCTNDANNGQNCDPGYDHGSIRTTAGWIGAGKLAGDGQLGDGTVNDGLWHNVVVNWNAMTRNLSYTFDGVEVTSYTFPASGANSLETILGGTNKAYFGYTASTGNFGGANSIGFNSPCTIPLYFDTDGDGILDYLDLDSDNDGCLDAIEGNENVTTSQLVTAVGTLTVGIGSTAANKNLGNTVDLNGVPTIVNAGGAADIGSDQGQGVGSSQNASVNSCPTTCTKPGDFTSSGAPTKVGITVQDKASTWPEAIPNGHIALESREKGLVITRVAHVSTTPNLTTDSIKDPKEGMLVYDIQDSCVKLFNGLTWNCIRRSCNDTN
ncbi:lectin-like domain-containing protein [Chryseobacterium formosense]|nr:hypothetical protein [Chryseobacterium formosense]